jgi:hypothetical protein
MPCIGTAFLVRKSKKMPFILRGPTLQFLNEKTFTNSLLCG